MSQSKILFCKNLHEYLKTLTAQTLQRLYDHPAACMKVFRVLPELAQNLVQRLLYVNEPAFQAGLAKWVSRIYSSDLEAASKALQDLNIWHEVTINDLPGWKLSENFKENLKKAVYGGGEPWTISRCVDPNPSAKDIPFLDSYATKRWETVLYYMAVAQEQEEKISAEAVRVLLHSGLMKRDDDDDDDVDPVITREGFQFLMMDTPSQVWYFIQQYLDTVADRKLDLVECLSLLFQLGFSKLGKDYTTERMSQGLQVFLQHLREFGLVYQKKRSTGRFYPTSLALSIASAQRQTNSSVQKPGFIIVETNYRVYAYTNSDLQVALLGLFCEMTYRLPNLYVANITRESVLQAFRSGITAKQLVSFLSVHAHPNMLQAKQGEASSTSSSIIPPAIIDQIRLWELERDRFTFNEGVMYNHFMSQMDFETVKNYARNLGVLLWQAEEQRMMVVAKAGHDKVKRFWIRHSKRSS